MAAIDDLIKQIEDPGLRARIAQEFHKVSKKKKFGLVFEEHLPEATPLYDIPVKRGALVAEKQGEISDIYVVTNIDADTNTVTCVNKESNEECQFQGDDLVSVAQFGDPIYPYLKPIDTVCNAPDIDLWHTLIEADNYHALQLLEYLYAGKVDCIYIDPPYNTGAKDWKYNNDYVDGSDAYRHSKWLSFIERRLKIAKKLLKREASVLIVTIDEKEYLHLGCLLEQTFPEANIQMITSVISGKGVSLEGQFSRVEEYIFIVTFGSMQVTQQHSNMLNDNEDEKVEEVEVEYIGLRRRNVSNYRTSRPNQFYPFFVDKVDGHIVEIGEVVPPNVDRNSVPVPEGCTALWPLDPAGQERIWGLVPESSRQLMDLGCIKIGSWNAKRQTGTVKYWASGNVEKLQKGEIIVKERDQYGTIIRAIYSDPESLTIRPRKVWNVKSHNASTHGTLLLKKILVEKRFSFPKSLYAVKDTLKFFIDDKPDAIVLDFFAGSGTTLHAVNLINAEDNGKRRCIMVTNNEVSDEEARNLMKNGYKPGDEEWESLGIARYVTWPRTVCSIEGCNVNGELLIGNYLDSETPMSAGFKANAVYFKLGFLDKTMIALGRQFREMLPTLWMKNGCIGPCPSLAEDNAIPDMMILHENRMAILIDEKAYSDFKDKVNQTTDIDMAFIITDSEDGYREMANGLHVVETCQLYRDYLDNFRINVARR